MNLLKLVTLGSKIYQVGFIKITKIFKLGRSTKDLLELAASCSADRTSIEALENLLSQAWLNEPNAHSIEGLLTVSLTFEKTPKHHFFHMWWSQNFSSYGARLK